MDFKSKLEELQLTTEEMTRFSKALKDDKFREMLHEYAEEISKPENRKKYEEEITQLEQERGMDVQFVHPKPHHVLKTSLNGKEKCFINVCSNVLIDKPVCKAGRGQGGRVGQHWSLPYSLAPGRLDRDSKGNKCTIYDVVFHPDTLYIAGKNSRFMKLVNNTATQGVEDAFKVTLDQINAKVLKIPYKGVPHPAVIRKPIPGKEKASPCEEFRPIDCPDTAPNQQPKTAAAVPPQDFRIPGKESSPEPGKPVKPHYTIKYRSVVDLQDYRCSRDSAPSPHPKEIVVTVDLPLIKSARDIDLNVTKRNLVLESQKPAYKLELQLSYPVHDEKGDAKLNKAKKQLTITLPVLPAKQTVSQEGENADQVQALLCEGKEVVSVDKNEQNDTNLMIQPTGESVVDLSGVSNSLSEMNFTLDEGTTTASFPEDTEGLPEEQVVNRFPEQTGPAPGHKDIKSSSLTLETEVQLKEEVDCVHSLEQCQTDRTLKSSVVLREENPNGSDVIVRDRATSAALPFQNPLWFELD